MEELSGHLRNIKVPCGSDNVYKDECVYSYDTPETPTGLYVSLTTFLGFGKDHVEGYYRKTGHAVFLHIFREKIEISGAADIPSDGPEKKITRLAIGVEGGFDPSENKRKFEYKDHLNVVIYPETVKISYPNIDLPLLVSSAVEAILSAESMTTKLEKDALTGTWDGENRQVSQYARNLEQLGNGKKIPPSGWKCEKCDLTSNLWLNMTDGSIRCGRRFFDGSGGNDHAVKHYKECGYPLAVKLGTITADGKGDVFSYAEDDMVEDPNLMKHLAHFGINTNQLKKTEKSMIELELDLNQRIGEWSILTESSSNLEPISGAGFTGMKNLGNSCYMNSVMQTLFTIPDFINRFVDKAPQIFGRYPSDPANDFDAQFAKLGKALQEDKDIGSISPLMFKNLIGKNHKDFSSKQQQDAQEFLLHVISELEKHSRNGVNPADALKFQVEDRVECCATGKVKYTKRDEYCLPLHIPLQLATNAAEVREYDQKVAEAESRGQKIDPNLHVRPRIPLQCCLERFGQTELVEQFYSTAINGQTTAKKTTRLATMPDYMILHLERLAFREDGTCVKLDVAIEIPDILDLNALLSSGLQSNEELLSDSDQTSPQPESIASSKSGSQQNFLDFLSFSEENPYEKRKKSKKFTIEFQRLMRNYHEVNVLVALKKSNNNIDKAEKMLAGQLADRAETLPRGNISKPKNHYRLVGFISHMDIPTSEVGHYVCHILKNDKWVIFNDSKVAISQNPPKELGYLYLFERIKPLELKLEQLGDYNGKCYFSDVLAVCRGCDKHVSLSKLKDHFSEHPKNNTALEKAAKKARRNQLAKKRREEENKLKEDLARLLLPSGAAGIRMSTNKIFKNALNI